MKVIETNFNFRGALEKRASTRRIILHHAAAVSCTAQDIHTWHLNNQWAGIGYHYFVRKDGSVYRGRPENTVGAHAGGHNSDSVGVCFEGNFETEMMPAAQSAAGAALIKEIKSRYGTVSIIRHKDVNATACPGKNFPFDAIQGSAAVSPAVSAPAATVSDDSVPDALIQSGDCGDTVKWLQARLNVKGYTLAEDGIFGEKTLTALRDFQNAYCLKADGIAGAQTKAALLRQSPGDPYPAPSGDLKKGDKGAGVKWVQTALISKGYPLKQYGTDGIFGTETENAVKEFQKARALSADGIVGIKTRGAILA